MDEIDAALDFRNVSIVANYIKDRTKNAQFIIISLRYGPFPTPFSVDDLTNLTPLIASHPLSYLVFIQE